MSKKVDLYTEATGRKLHKKEIPISQIIIDKSKLDQQLLSKMLAFENIKNSQRKEVSIFCNLTLSYLDSLCTLDFQTLGFEEKKNAIDIVTYVINNIQHMLEGLVLSIEALEKTISTIKDIATFSLVCFENTNMPILMPFCENSIRLLEYSHVIGACIGLNKFKEKDIKYIREYSEFLIRKSLEVKARN
ncbi:MAG: hypothetical protein ABFD08_18680 [Syntrophomonas sp.]